MSDWLTDSINNKREEYPGNKKKMEIEMPE